KHQVGKWDILNSDQINKNVPFFPPFPPRRPPAGSPYFTARGGGANSRVRNSRLMGVASQTFAVLSKHPVTMREPSGLNDAESTNPVWPLSVRAWAPLRASQTFAVPS